MRNNKIKLAVTSMALLLLTLMPANIAEAEGKAEGPSVPNGHTFIVSKLNDNKILDNNNDASPNNVTIWEKLTGNNQKWTFHYDYRKDAYKIKNVANNKVLAWDSNKGNNVISYDDLPDAADQYWRLDSAQQHGYVVIKNYHNPNMVLDLYQSNTNNGTNIQVHPRNNSMNQSWKIEQAPMPNFSILNNRFGIETSKYPNMSTFITDLKFQPENNKYKLRRATMSPADNTAIKSPFNINIYTTHNGYVSGLKYSKQIPAGILMDNFDKMLEEIPALEMGEAIQLVAASNNLYGTPKIYITGGIINEYDSFDPANGMNNNESSRRAFILTPNGLKLDPMIMK